jgi:DNA-binding MarR family transcriptional regulator
MDRGAGVTPDDEGHFGYILSDAARLMRTVFDRRVRALGLTRSQWLVLTRLHRRPGASQTELAEMLEVEKASAGRMVDRMERNGWVARRPDATDRRVNRIYLTREAERVHARMWVIAEATIDDALVGLGTRERTELTRLLGRVKTRLLRMADGESGTVEEVSRAVAS